MINSSLVYSAHASIFYHYYRVVTNLENLENSGISVNVEFSGNSVQPQGKILTNKSILVRYSNICVKQLLTCYIAGVDVE